MAPGLLSVVVEYDDDDDDGDNEDGDDDDEDDDDEDDDDDDDDGDDDDEDDNDNEDDDDDDDGCCDDDDDDDDDDGDEDDDEREELTTLKKLVNFIGSRGFLLAAPFPLTAVFCFLEAGAPEAELSTFLLRMLGSVTRRRMYLAEYSRALDERADGKAVVLGGLPW